MRDPLDQEMLLRRIQAERAKGTSSHELMDIISDMIESQRLASYLAQAPEDRQAENLVRPFFHGQYPTEENGAAMGNNDGLTALARHLAKLRASTNPEPLSPEARRQKVESVLERLKTYSDDRPVPSDRKADDK